MDAEIRLDLPSLALHVPPMIGAAKYAYTRDAMLLVLASHLYDDADYIRDFRAWKNQVTSG
jgi:UDP-2-acetamido-3-amino-2,3-dideoxy-glucuronate N-acetyltransferase